MAGGRNERMKGSDKSFIKINGVPIIKRTVDLFQGIFDEVIIVSNSPSHYDAYGESCSIVSDIVGGIGPLGGIYAALTHTSKESIFCCACDMPFLHIGLIYRLGKAPEKDGFDCIIPCSDRGIEPLHAIYSKKILTRLKESLQRKDLSVREFLKHCKCKYIEAKPQEFISFFNINTPEDLNEAKTYGAKRT